MESGQFIRVKESFPRTDSFANDPSLIHSALICRNTRHRCKVCCSVVFVQISSSMHDSGPPLRLVLSCFFLKKKKKNFDKFDPNTKT